MQEDKTDYHQMYYNSPSLSPFFWLFSHTTMYFAAAIMCTQLSLIQQIMFSGNQVEFLNMQEQTPF
jgi:hypothetical protein